MCIRDRRLDVFDVLVGINLLREGLDIPEITLVAILDADKEGFLRSHTSVSYTHLDVYKRQPRGRESQTFFLLGPFSYHPISLYISGRVMSCLLYTSRCV